MHVNKAKVISCRFQNHLVCPKLLWSLSILMYGDLPQHLLGEKVFMAVLWMILANILGSTLFGTSLKSSKHFTLSKNLLSALSIGKF
jgi:hypothetical protein